jgi:hypothetical protein
LLRRSTYREVQRRHPTTNPPNINHVLFDRLLSLGLAPVHAGFFQYQPFGIVGSERIGVGGPCRKASPVSACAFSMALAARSAITVGDIDPGTIERVLPKVHQYLERTGQIGQHILVCPFLHHYLGGFRITRRCESELPGLFLAGEITGGLQGCNRLMGNGVTDALVHGRIAGHAAAAYVKS